MEGKKARTQTRVPPLHLSQVYYSTLKDVCQAFGEKFFWKIVGLQ